MIEYIELILFAGSFIFLIALGFNYDGIMSSLNKILKKLNGYLPGTTKEQDVTIIKTYKLDTALKILFLIGLFFITEDYEVGKGQGLRGPFSSALILLLYWSLFFFGVHKVQIIEGKTVIVYRLLWKKKVKIKNIKTISETLGYYKVVHSSGSFRFTDFITGSSGLVSNLVSCNHEIQVIKFSHRKFYNNPMGLNLAFGLIEKAILLLGCIALIFFYYINN